MGEEEDQGIPEMPVLGAVLKAGPKLTLEEATARLGPELLQALEAKFNGNLTEVRAPDEKDQFFQ